MRILQNRFRRSEPELHGPESGIEVGPRTSPGLRSAPLLVQIPNSPTSTGIEGVFSHESRDGRALSKLKNLPL
eukprot:755211-Alexandrium_andersonii.AAC.1